MARLLFRAPPGTRDVLPPESARRRRMVGAFAVLAERAGFGLLESPIFEEAAVFSRLGEHTDIVSKELFEFFDRASPPRRFALRPELTASVCRAFVQHRPTVPWKVWYSGPQFRYERPQAGRYRQFSQIGAESLGVDDPCADVEIMALGMRLLEGVGLTGVRLKVNSLGDAESRHRYVKELTGSFRHRFNQLSQQSRATLERNPLRVLDSKRPEDEALIAGAPEILDFLSPGSRKHFAAVTDGLASIGVAFEVSPRLVRGLDYYTRTAFEFGAGALDAAQDAVGGGGRYDRLVEELGGPPTPGIGLAMGVDRILLACDAEGVFPGRSGAVQVFVVDITGGGQATVLCDRLRQAGIGADRAFGGRSMKAQMKVANRSGARVALIVGPDELSGGTVTVRDLRAGRGQRSAPVAGVIAEVKALLSEELP